MGLYKELVKVNTESSFVPKEEQEIRKILRSSHLIEENMYKEFNQRKFHFVKQPDNQFGSFFAMFAEENNRERFLYPHMDQYAVLFDIGAAVGSWTLPALTLGAKAIAFEPDPRSIDTLYRSISLNGFNIRAVLLNYAVFDTDNQLISFDELEEVPTITIDSVVEKLELFPSYIKIDVEGAESRVIQGGLKTIKEHKPKIFLENHLKYTPGSKEHIDKILLEEIGYRSQVVPIYAPEHRSSDISFSFFY